MSKKLQELLEDFFRAEDGEVLVFQGEEELMKKLSLLLRALGQEVTLSKEENNDVVLRCIKKRPKAGYSHAS